MLKLDLEELKDVCIPVVEYLKEKGHPHCQIIITDSNIKATEDIAGIPCGSERLIDQLIKYVDKDTEVDK